MVFQSFTSANLLSRSANFVLILDLTKSRSRISTAFLQNLAFESFVPYILKLSKFLIQQKAQRNDVWKLNYHMH